jgi:hypothetical protein
MILKNIHVLINNNMESIPDTFWEVAIIALMVLVFIWFGFTAVVILRRQYVKSWIVFSILVALYGLVSFYGTLRFTDALKRINASP